MAHENVRIVRANYEHLSRVGDVDWALVDPAATFDASRLPGFGVYRGRDEFHAAWLPYKYAFDNWDIEVEELIEGRGDRVFAAITDGGRIKGSNDEVFNRFFHGWQLWEGRITGWAVFLDSSEALEAAGLRD
jgi:ketosteroid isomerase-like protein